MNNIEASLIIGYHNEAGLIQLLLESIAESIRPRIEVILVDDASTVVYEEGESFQGYKYEGTLVYVRQDERKGIGAAFDRGVNLARTNRIILCGGDVVFKGADWLDHFLEDLEKNEKAFICSTCINLHEHATDINAEGIVKGYGAYIDVFVKEETIFKTLWFGEIIGKKSVFEIPCILGAAYAVNKEWYKYVRGFEGHRYWGCLEPYISIKNWMLGGTNLIDTRVEIGHWFIGKQNRFEINSWNIAYNKAITALILGGELKDKLFDNVNYVEGIDVAVDYLVNNTQKHIGELRSYVDDHQVRSLSQFMKWQDSLISKLGKSPLVKNP